MSGSRGRNAIDVVPERAPALQIATVFGSFLLGPLAGLRLAMLLAPGSDAVETLSVLAFATVFVAGIAAWAGWGIVTVVLAGLARMLRGRRPGPEGLAARDRVVPPGHRAFLILGPVLTVPVGALAGLLTALPVGTGVVAWGALGTAYGWALRRAARTGYLPFPEPE